MTDVLSDNGVERWPAIRVEQLRRDYRLGSNVVAALRGLDVPLADGLKLERELYLWLQRTDDAREGARAFAEKRTPEWKGR